MSFSNIEYHIIQLKSITELLDSILNHMVMDVTGEGPSIEIHFNNEQNKMFFNLVLVDLFSKFDKCLVGNNDLTGLDILEHIAKTQPFASSHATTLKKHVYTFKKWLFTEITVDKLWFPTINLKTSLTLNRKDVIYICGNISKHCFLRLTAVAKTLIQIFKSNSITLDIYDALVILPEFYEWFHSNILGYLGTYITEMLNNIRWGIQEYLKPVFDESIKCIGGDGRYEFNMPSGVTTKFGNVCFWDLMNEVRRKPFISQFEGTKYLKTRY